MHATINCDMGKGFGLYRMGDDAALMPLIDLANVACGFHGSDPSIMRATVQLAAKARERTLRALRDGVVTTTAGQDIAVKAKTVCVHSDTPNAVAIAAELARALRQK